MILTLLVFDSVTRGLIQGAVVSFLSPEKISQITDSKGKAVFELSGDGFYTYQITKDGYVLYQAAIDIVQGKDLIQTRYITPQAAKPSAYQQSEGGEAIGYSCVLKSFSIGSSGVRFEIRHEPEGRILQGEFYDDVKEAGISDPRCWELPPPPPISTQEVSDKVDVLGSVINGLKSALGGLEKTVSDIGKAVSEQGAEVKRIADFIGKMDEWFKNRLTLMKDMILEWIVEAFIGIIEKVLDREVKL